MSRIFLNPGASFNKTSTPFVLSPTLKFLQMHRLRLPVLREGLTCHSVASWRHGYSSVPKLENLDQDKRKQMHRQPLAILVPAVAAPLQHEDSHSPAPRSPYNRVENRVSLSVLFHLMSFILFWQEVVCPFLIELLIKI